MQLREALIAQSPSLALQRQAQAEIAKLDSRVLDLIEERDELQRRLDARGGMLQLLKSRRSELEALALRLRNFVEAALAINAEGPIAQADLQALALHHGLTPDLLKDIP